MGNRKTLYMLVLLFSYDKLKFEETSFHIILVGSCFKILWFQYWFKRVVSKCMHKLVRTINKGVLLIVLNCLKYSRLNQKHIVSWCWEGRCIRQVQRYSQNISVYLLGTK